MSDEERIEELMAWPVPGDRPTPIPRAYGGQWGRISAVEPARIVLVPVSRQLPRPWLRGGVLLLAWLVGVALLLGAVALAVG